MHSPVSLLPHGQRSPTGMRIYNCCCATAGGHEPSLLCFWLRGWTPRRRFSNGHGFALSGLLALQLPLGYQSDSKTSLCSPAGSLSTTSYSPPVCLPSNTVNSCFEEVTTSIWIYPFKLDC